MAKEIVYDYYPTLSKAKEAKKRLERKGYRTSIRKVFMSDTFVLYLKGEKNEHIHDQDRRY